MTATADPSIELLANLHFISVARYHAMIEAGILGEDDPVEFLDGKIVCIINSKLSESHLDNRRQY